MKILIVYSHPNPHSFNYSVLENLIKGLENRNHIFDVVDLYKIGFDPILKMRDLVQFNNGKIPEDVLEQQNKVSNSDVIIFVHPIWWGWLPAILKGYLDRVFTLGFAYKMGKERPEGLLKDKKVIFIRTTALPEKDYLVSGVEDLIRNLLNFKFVVVCGVESLEHNVFYEVPRVSKEIRQKYLKEIYKLGKQL
jgi:NAD(P)H dehydrogenase (quinone)